MSSLSPPAAAGAPASSAAVRRSRLGCWICREKKVKCDEQHPRCGRCARLGKDCDYVPRSRKKYAKRKKPAQPGAQSTTDHEIPSRTPTAGDTALPQIEGPADSGYYETLSNHSDEQPAPTPIGSEERNNTQHQHHDQHQSLRPAVSSLPPACLEILAPSDYDTISFFRSGLSGAIDTKVPEHSGPAILWMLAQKNPMVLHTVCALGGRNLCYQKPMPESERQARQAKAVEHYAAGLRLLVVATQNIHETRDFEYILGALWLMIVYEQKYGDGCGTGLIAHLQGAASLFQSRMRDLRYILEQDEFHDPTSYGVLGCDSDMEVQQQLSPLATRIVVWISLLDGAAALNGFGGAFNDLLAEAMCDRGANDTTLSRLKGFCALQKHSNLVYQAVWGASYPRNQLLEDLESSQLFTLYAESAQLRCILAKLTGPDAGDDPDAASRRETVTKAIRDLELRYSEIFAAASLLEIPAEDYHRRFVMNVRFIVPFYYAVVLCFFRLTKKDASLCGKQRRALQEIMTLAFQSHRDGGKEAVTRIAWPLFVAALESDDTLHRAWIMEQYELLAAEGENYRRAREALRIALSEQRPHERRVSYWELINRNEIDRFVIV